MPASIGRNYTRCDKHNSDTVQCAEASYIHIIVHVRMYVSTMCTHALATTVKYTKYTSKLGNSLPMAATTFVQNVLPEVLASE